MTAAELARVMAGFCVGIVVLLLIVMVLGCDPAFRQERSSVNIKFQCAVGVEKVCTSKQNGVCAGWLTCPK